jgi:hypothetical protein
MNCAVQYQKWLCSLGNRSSFALLPVGIEDFSVRAGAERKPGIACQINESWARRSDGLDNVLAVWKGKSLCVQLTKAGRRCLVGVGESGSSNRRA